MASALVIFAQAGLPATESFSVARLVAAILAGYLLGALPFGWLVARAHGVNIFAVGSKSPGATNVRRTLGARAGNTVFALDALKGAVAAGWPLATQLDFAHLEASIFARSAIHVADNFGSVLPYCLAGLTASIVGHSFSCFTRFKGGKGVATGAGGFFILMPVVTLISTVCWIALFLSTRYVSLASIAAAIAMPTGSFFFEEPPLLNWSAVLVSTFVIVRHRANIVRLLNGTENKSQKK